MSHNVKQKRKCVPHEMSGEFFYSSKRVKVGESRAINLHASSSERKSVTRKYCQRRNNIAIHLSGDRSSKRWSAKKTVCFATFFFLSLTKKSGGCDKSRGVLITHTGHMHERDPPKSADQSTCAYF